MKVIFIPVSTNKAKLQVITATAQQHFLARIPLTFYVANSEAAHYIDNLLWKSPPDSFIPHSIDGTHPFEWIHITTQLSLPSSTRHLFNLSPQIEDSFKYFEIIYDFNDSTDPVKSELSKKRKENYLHRGFAF